MAILLGAASNFYFRRPASLSLAAILLAAACSSDENNGGASTKDAEACQKFTAASCGSASACEQHLRGWRNTASAWGCDGAEELVACVAQYGWVCASQGGTSVMTAANQCTSLLSAAQCVECSGFYAPTSCNFTCKPPGGDVAAACGPATASGSDCQCSSGAKTGATFHIQSSCEADLPAAIATNCR